jgi:hypothetical protein
VESIKLRAFSSNREENGATHYWCPIYLPGDEHRRREGEGRSRRTNNLYQCPACPDTVDLQADPALPTLCHNQHHEDAAARNSDGFSYRSRTAFQTYIRTKSGPSSHPRMFFQGQRRYANPLKPGSKSSAPSHQVQAHYPTQPRHIPPATWAPDHPVPTGQGHLGKNGLDGFDNVKLVFQLR